MPGAREEYSSTGTSSPGLIFENIFTYIWEISYFIRFIADFEGWFLKSKFVYLKRNGFILLFYLCPWNHGKI